MAEWLGHWTWNLEVVVSSPILTAELELFLGRPLFNSLATFVNSQLVCLLPVGIFNHVMFIWIICFIISSLVLKSPIGGVVNQDIIIIIIIIIIINTGADQEFLIGGSKLWFRRDC